VTWDPTNQLSIDDQQKAILYNHIIDFATQNNIQLGQPLTPQQISSVDIDKQAYQMQGGWMEYTGTQLQPGGFMSAVNLDVQAQNITAVNNAFQVLNADGTPDAAGTAALLSSLKQQLGSNFTQTACRMIFRIILFRIRVGGGRRWRAGCQPFFIAR
jgi:hypothetical protein